MSLKEFKDVIQEPADSLLLARNIATAVAELHTIRFVHNKLSAENIVVDCLDH